MPFGFENGSFLKLAQVHHEELDWVKPMLMDDERPLISLKSVRDGVCFTNLRIILRNEQGVTGTKVALSTLPYDSVTSYSLETAGPFELSLVMRLYVREAGELKLELIRDSDVRIFDGLLSRAIVKRTK